MKPASFEYFDPRTVAEAVELLQKNEDADAKILAGGQSLMPLLNMRMARPSVLIDLSRIAELNYIREENGGFAIGAMTTKRAVEDHAGIKQAQPLFHAATILIGHPQIRNRGTVGGSIAQADPAAEYPAAAVAIGATMKIAGASGTRTVAADDFFVTYLTTAIEPTEILTELFVPKLPTGSGWSFLEVARRHGDFAMTGVAVTLQLRGGQCADSRVVLFGVGPTPLRARAVEDAIRGEAPSEKLFEQVAVKAIEGVDEPMSDVHASAEYRKHLAQVLTRRGLAEAAARAKSA